MPNREPGKPLEPGDLIGNRAERLGIARNDGRAGCLCYVYAHVLEDIGVMLGAVEDENGEINDDGPENKNAIENMKKAINEIHRKFSHFKDSSEIQESSPEEYSAALYSDIKELTQKLGSIRSLLKVMVDVYDIAKRDLSENPEQITVILGVAVQYENYLSDCRTCIIAIITKIKWWRKKLSPQTCQDQKADGVRVEKEKV